MCCANVLADVPLDGLSHADKSVHLDLAPTPVAAREARRFLREHLRDVDAVAVDATLLCASEVVTNGVLHARTAIVLGVTRGKGRLLVTVGDRSEAQPRRPEPDDDRTSGRGLQLIEALADAWGVHPQEVGKTVWFTVTTKKAG